MANLKRIKKTLVGLSEEELKDVLEFLTDDDEEETEVEEIEEVEEEKKPQKVEPQQSETVTLKKSDLEELLKEYAVNFATKSEIDKVKETVEKAQKKAKPFGKEQKVPKEDKSEEPPIEDYLAKLNSQFI